MEFLFLKMKIIIHILTLMLVSCTHVFFQPDRIHYYDPALQGVHDFEDMYFGSYDNLKLHAQYLKGEKNKKGLLVHFHGNAENLSSHFMHFLWLPKFGYDYFIFDYRGYGRSWGKPSFDGAIADGKEALDVAWKLFKKEGYEKFIVYGQSLGGPILLKSLQKFKHAAEIDLLVLDSTFVDYKKEAFDVLSGNAVTFLFSPLAFMLVSNTHSPRKDLAAINIPTLVIHGKKDRTVDFHHGEYIFNNLKTKKWFWPIEKGRHTDIFFNGKKEYRKKFVDFIDSL